jgi:hypothetical protein
LGQSDEKPAGPADVAEPVHVFIPDYFAYQLRAALAEPFERLVDVVHGEHDAEVAQGIHWGIAMIRDGRRRDEAREFEPAVPVRHAHHGNLDALIAQSCDTSSPFPFDRGPPFELEAKLKEEINRLSEVIDDDSYVVHPFKRHVSNLPDLEVSSSLTTEGGIGDQAVQADPTLFIRRSDDQIELVLSGS